jgi:hypothetical protein
LGVSRQTLARLAREGIAVKGSGHGLYAIVTVANYVRHLQEASRGGAGSDDWQRERVRYMRARATRAEREQELFEGSVYPRKLVEDVIATILVAVRAAFLRIPTRAVPLLEQARTPAERHEVVQNLIFEALDRLADLNIERIDDAAAHARKGDNGAAYRDDDDGPPAGQSDQ